LAFRMKARRSESIAGLSGRSQTRRIPQLSSSYKEICGRAPRQGSIVSFRRLPPADSLAAFVLPRPVTVVLPAEASGVRVPLAGPPLEFPSVATTAEAMLGQGTKRSYSEAVPSSQSIIMIRTPQRPLAGPSQRSFAEELVSLQREGDPPAGFQRLVVHDLLRCAMILARSSARRCS
jgi:hypothetical protein